MNSKIITLLTVAMSAASIAQAQFSGANQQVDSVQQRQQMQQTSRSLAATNVAPELYPGETRDLGPQTVLQFTPRTTFFTAFVDEQYLYSDNIFLAQKGKQAADVLVSTVNAALAPTPYALGEGTLAPRLGYQHQWFNYDLAGGRKVNVIDYTGSGGSITKVVNLDTFDFNASTVFADAAWRWHDWTFTAGADYRRLLDSGNYEEFYNEIVPRLSIRRDLTLSESVLASLLYEGNFRFTETQLPPPGNDNRFNNRTDQSLALLLNWSVCSHFVLQPYYRFQWTHYTESIAAFPITTHREDWLHSLGITALFPITDHAAFRAFVGYDLMDTDGVYAQDYKKLDLGGGLNLSIRF